MSENKFIKRLKGEQTTKSVLEIKNESAKTSFANMPQGTSNAINVYSDHRGNATAVLEGTDIWKLNTSQFVVVPNAFGDGRDFTSTYTVFGSSLWVNATYTFDQPKIFTGATQWTLKLCGHSLLSSLSSTIGFSLIIKFGNAVTITKSFSVSESAFEFCKEFIVDFSESEQTAIKVANGDTMTVQLLCADATASATIYNGMTVFTALQRRVDGDAVASDKKTFDEVVDDVEQLQEDLDDLEEYVDDTFVRLDGESIMTGPLKMRATSSFQCAIAPFWDGVGFYKLNSDDSVTLIASIETPDGFVPWVTNTYNIGSSLKKWKNLYLSGKAYVSVINNGYDIAVPVTNSADTLALKSEVDLAANSGRMITDQGVWYAKMYAATVAPSAENGTNYADFSQVDGQGNPIIVIYERQNGAWVQSETITPPAEYDGYVPITSKIWDITEQAGQQGGRILWNHQSKEFTPYPQIVSFEDIEVTGNSTVIMPQNPSVNQIVNKDYVDNAIGNGTITITQGGTTKGTFTTNQGGNTTIDLDAGGGAGHNVGDIFFTMRPDNELNGAVECDGATYQTTDFTGAQSIGALLESHKVAYISLSEYEWRLQNDGSVSEFGWDGTGTTAFRVPKLDTNIFIQSRTNAGDFCGIYQPGLPNIKSNVTTNAIFNNVRNQGGTNGAVTMTQTSTINLASGGGQQGLYSMYIDASQSSSIYKNNVNTVQPYAVRYRLMVQLATATTDEALETCTGVLADVTDLKTNKSGYCSFNTNTRIAITNTNQTATKNGWLVGSLWSSGTDTYLSVIVNDIEVSHGYRSNGVVWSACNVQIPIKQGQTFRYDGNATLEQNHMYFYPDD